MPPSHASTNAKAAKKFQRRQLSAQAKSTGAKFTQRQSRFELRREEEQVRSVQQHRGGSGATEIRVGDGLIGNKDAWQQRQAHSFTAGSTDTPSPFELASRDKLGNKAATAASTLSGATFGFTRSRAQPLAHPPSTGTRTTRRTARFNLSSAPDESGAAAENGLLGVERRARETAPSDPFLAGLSAEPADGESAPPQKMTREERFREVLASSKSHRAQLQRERAEREAETVELDAEINGLLHLLPKRDKEEEEREAFARSGRPEVRALFKAFHAGHTAKQLTVKASGEFSVTALSAKADGAAAAPAELDERGRELLARVRRGTARSREELEADAAPSPTATAAAGDDSTGAVSARRGAKDSADTAAVTFVEDDFDAMLNQMRLDTRRARATDRLLDETEEAALAAQQALLEEDRRAVPQLGLAEKDQVQVSRGEWVRGGGDNAFQMADADADGAYADNVDIPSSYESDSAASSVVGDEERQDDAPEDSADEGDEESGAEDLDPTTAPASAADRTVVGSAALDRLLGELEALAGPIDAKTAAAAAEQLAGRQERLMPLLLRLHQYAKTHVLEVTNAFRLILVEAQRSFLRGQRGALSRPLMLSLVAIANLFPTSDYRHEVSTPFYLFLCSTLMQMRLDSLANVHCYVGLCALLTQSVRLSGGKFVGEAVVALLNVLALQLPRTVLEPVRYQGLALPIPLVERCEAALLTSAAAPSSSSSSAAATPWRLLETEHDAEQLLLCAYHQLTVLADLYSVLPAFPVAMCEPFLALDALLQARSVGSASPAVVSAHVALKELLIGYAQAAEDHRAPLTMRTFRPRPIRLFDPLLAQQEESAVKTELRVIKREIREDKKRVMRHLSAEATVRRRAHEKEQAAIDSQRERKLHQVMGALQRQQHMMNTVDAVMAKAKSRPKKGISGAAKQSSAAAEGEGGDA